MKLTLLFASILAVSGFCAAAPSIQERYGSNATITSQSSFIGDKDHELQIITASCPDRRRALGSTDNVDLTERDTCLPDPATSPTFTVLQDQVIFIIFNTCQLDFGVGPQTTGICGSNWVHIIFHELTPKGKTKSELARHQSHPPSCRGAPTWLAERPRATQACTISTILGRTAAAGSVLVCFPYEYKSALGRSRPGTSFEAADLAEQAF
ncbi:hypothetical protein C8R44DRAFT_747162 [Mycena epipterygia]|nr:hypothetical protein C8R44DRAFT_747162 [Mycena epipterygia]